jgi:Glycosyl hydrolases family 18/Chitin recognition protein
MKGLAIAFWLNHLAGAVPTNSDRKVSLVPSNKFLKDTAAGDLSLEYARIQVRRSIVKPSPIDDNGGNYTLDTSSVTSFSSLWKRDGHTQCGKDSEDGKTKCGLNVCCSYHGWCGVEDVHCHDPEPKVGKTPCQEGFGSCSIASRPHCGTASGTATRRRIAYYQSWNIKNRKCDHVEPKDINVKGLTHLYYAFVSFNPTTWQIQLMDSDDESNLREFTDLKKKGVETWLAVGGWTFNDKGPTQQAFSNMVSTQENRRAFIDSLVTFMNKYGFQGGKVVMSV